MECKICKSECLESELKNGLCENCYNKYGEIKIKNKLTSKLYFIIYGTWIIGIIISILISIAMYNTNKNIFAAILIFVVTFAIFYFSTLLLEISSEIIQLLEDIKNKE